MHDILELMQKRQSARGAFDPMRPIPDADLNKILEAARWAPTAHNMQNFEIVVVDDRKLLEAISNTPREIDEVFIRENYEQFSFSEEELKRKKVGVLAAMFPQSWRSPTVTPQLHEELVHGFLGTPVRKCAALLVVTYDPHRRAPASEGDFLGAISLGCLMENMWIMAETLGIGFHVLSMLAVDSVETSVKRLLHIPEELKIAYAVRLGYPLAPPQYLRVRREIVDFTHHNQFGIRGFGKILCIAPPPQKRDTPP